MLTAYLMSAAPILLRAGLAIAATALTLTKVYAEVDPQNATFIIGFDDVDQIGAVQIDQEQEAGKTAEASIRRTYSSRRSAIGIFGQGWCSDLESFLEFNEAGFTLVHCGGGLRQGYAIQSSKPNSTLYKAVDTDLPARLEGDRYYVNSSCFCGGEKVAGSLLIFDPAGYLVEAFYVDGSRISIDRIGREIKSLSLNDVVDVNFRMNSNGQVTALSYIKVDEFGHRSVKKIQYQYDDQGNLVSVVNAWGNTYKYGYDADGNLIQIDYPDSTNVVTKYDVDRDLVVEQRDRFHCTTTYKHEFDDPEMTDTHYWTWWKIECPSTATNRPDAPELRTGLHYAEYTWDSNGVDSYGVSSTVEWHSNELTTRLYDPRTGRLVKETKVSKNTPPREAPF